MKSSIVQAKYFKQTSCKLVMALAFASLVSGFSISPAFAAKKDEHGQADQRDKHNQHATRGNRVGNGHRPEYRRPYSYAQPVYVPPPVYYEPRQSPGISLFFPLDLRR